MPGSARRLLLAGESWSTTSIHTKGFDSFFTSEYAEGGWPFIRALEASGWVVDFQPNHVAAERFPSTRLELDQYDVIVLSDIGANTLLLPGSVFRLGQRSPQNRLTALAEWVQDGGALLMVGGYLSFQGVEAKANYRNTPIADVLPVLLEFGDDRQEAPEGVQPLVVGSHPVTADLGIEWPVILGYQRMRARPGASVLATVGPHPLVVVGAAGEGRAAAVATDMGPHWLPQEFIDWPGFALLWNQLVDWLAEGNTRESGR